MKTILFRFVSHLVALLVVLLVQSCTVSMGEGPGHGYPPPSSPRIARPMPIPPPGYQGARPRPAGHAELLGVYRVKRNKRTGEVIEDVGFVDRDDPAFNHPKAKRRPDSEAVVFDGKTGKLRQLPEHLDRAQMNELFDKIEAKKGGKKQKSVEDNQEEDADEPSAPPTSSSKHQYGADSEQKPPFTEDSLLPDIVLTR